MADRIVVAASAGVDPTAAVAQFARYEVVALVVDVGGRGREVAAVRERARAAGAVDALVVDAKAEFAEQYVVPAVRANASCAQHALVPGLRRPLVASHLVSTARRLGASSVAHATSTPDDVALVATVGALDPDLRVESLGAAPVAPGEQDLWGRVVSARDLDDPWAGPAGGDWARTQDPEPGAEPDEVLVTFEHGVPVALDGQRFPVVRLLQELDALAGRHGIGRHDVVADLVDGRKVRRVTETPGATALVTAHADLERLTLERDLLRTKQVLDREWAACVGDGRWASGLRRAADAFVEHTQQHVSGEVRLRLHGGTAAVTGRRSDQSLYDYELAGPTDGGPPTLAEAWSRPGRTAARRDRAN
ncbi:argininosuccinate synthase domain-containing protein [Curtobacterium sp. UCD-KPL2560]|uniref:argininosuccinate synthase domain-containing protein n=1 Tax=Curtobacterium sp. UCD-KPL2560 TaxID=1885315 RepID=UPI000824350C|nr:argininosuccinate synthase domain-containing protein [Curtobacterium sp. UCD-KPL2560]